MNRKIQTEKRRCSELASSALFDLVRDGMMHAAHAGVQASEVWLGPKESRVLEVEMNWQHLEGRLRSTIANDAAIIRGDMDGSQLMGMRVRLAVKDSVRVGVSWPNN